MSTLLSNGSEPQILEKQKCQPYERSDAQAAAILKKHLAASNLPQAEQFLREQCQLAKSKGARAKGGKKAISTYLFNLVINHCASIGDFDRAELWLAELSNVGLNPNPHTFGFLMNACATDDSWDRIDHYTAIMDRYEVPKNAICYNILLKACLHKKNHIRALELLEEMIKHGIEVSAITFNTIISVFSRAGDLARAEAILELMSQKGIGANVITYNSILNACAAQGDQERAEFWFNHMTRRQVKPTSITYGTLCKAYSRQGSLEKIDHIMQIAEASGEKLNEHFFASLITACVVRSPPNAARVEQALDEMATRGIFPKSLSRALTQAFGLNRATELLDRVRNLAKTVDFGEIVCASTKLDPSSLAIEDSCVVSSGGSSPASSEDGSRLKRNRRKTFKADELNKEKPPCNLEENAVPSIRQGTDVRLDTRRTLHDTRFNELACDHIDNASPVVAGSRLLGIQKVHQQQPMHEQQYRFPADYTRNLMPAKWPVEQTEECSKKEWAPAKVLPFDNPLSQYLCLDVLTMEKSMMQPQKVIPSESLFAPVPCMVYSF